ncbi:MAG: hypothetical protein WBB09_00530 [Candidatus Microthrix parvicella]
MTTSQPHTRGPGSNGDIDRPSVTIDGPALDQTDSHPNADTCEEAVPEEDQPMKAQPTNTVPTDTVPTNTVPTNAVPTNTVPGEKPDDIPDRRPGRFRERLEEAWGEARERRQPEEEPGGGEHGDDPEAWARALLQAEDPKEYFDTVSGLARVDQSSVLSPLEFDPDVPFHHPQATYVDPEPQGIETVKLYARTASPIFDTQIAAPFANPMRADMIADIYQRLMLDGRNLALITNHGDIVDIAVVLAGLTTAMCDGRTYGVLEEELAQEDLAEHFNIMVSRMVTTRQAFGIPALSVVANMARTFLSLPQTHSRRRARIDPELVRASNMLMRADLSRYLAQGGQLLAMAASGSQDLSLAANFAARVRNAWQGFRGEDHEGPSMHLQPLYPGTMKIMLECQDVLPLAVCMDPKNPTTQLGSITRVRTEDDCHRVMDWIAAAHQRGTGITTVYHDAEDDLLTNIRAAISR